MILVIGSALVRPEAADEALAISLRHVERSRTEPGCISHAVHRDVEEPNRLIFVERWTDMDALRTHFAVPDSRAFARALAGLSVERPEMTLYEASEVTA